VLLIPVLLVSVLIGVSMTGCARNHPSRRPQHPISIACNAVSQRFYVETLGCPKNQVDSDKLIGTLLAGGMQPADEPEGADLVVVNTCAFIDEARRESIDTILALDERRQEGARLVVTGCMAERYGAELADALPEVDQIAGFGVPIAPPAEGAGRRTLIPVTAAPLPELDLLNLPRPRASAPWAYVKIAEGCDRTCGFCAIPSFRGPQRSRDVAQILAEVDQLDAREIVLVAQDLASYGKDRPDELGAGSIVPLVRAVAERVDRTRLLYLYPSDLSDELIDAICATGVPYFDLSLQHVSKPLLRRMRRWGDGSRFMHRIDDIRRREPDAAFRSNFIVGYPGETEADHDELLRFVEQAELDWCGFFAYSPEDGTYAAGLDGAVDRGLVAARLAELREMQDEITARRRDAMIGRTVRVLVDRVGIARSVREAPEIDGVIHVGHDVAVGAFADVEIVDALGPDLVAAGAAVPDDDWGDDD
jgi:ribosomal protein S12 methylthiotransferase